MTPDMAVCVILAFCSLVGLLLATSLLLLFGPKPKTEPKYRLLPLEYEDMPISVLLCIVAANSKSETQEVILNWADEQIQWECEQASSL